jgi:5-methyltetrahydropteroyltriglutamate--homocysteine methyltransferase
LIRAANHSSYPRVGDHPLDQQIRHARKARDRGEATDADVVAAEDEVTAIVVAEQSRSFIDIVTDGMVRWEGPLSHMAHHLDGLESRDLVRWFDTNFYDRRPEAVGPVRRTGPFLVRDLEVAKGTAMTPVKVTLPGPVTFVRLSSDRHYGARETFARDVADALAAEVAALAAAGARHVQIDEPLLCRHPEDLDLVAECAARVFAGAGEGATTIVSTYFGDLARLDGARLGKLPGTHLGVDLVASDANFRLLAELPPEKGVVLGLFDARTTRQEDATDVAVRLAPHREHLERRDVIVGPQAGLELLPRDQAFEKLLHARYLVERLAKEWTWAS